MDVQVYESDVCSICLEPMCRSDLQRLSCGHKLHAHCWSQCQDNCTTRCPLCRKPQTRLARVQDHPHSWLAYLIFVVALGCLASLAMSGIWSKTASSDVQRTMLDLMPSSMPSAEFFRWINFDTCSNADSVSGVLGCVVMILLGNVCVWFFFGLIGSAARMPLALWHLSSKYGASIIGRGLFMFFGFLQVAPQIVALMIVMVGLGGYCFVAAEGTGMHPRLPNEDTRRALRYRE